jgi:hypothetical protein
MAKLLKSRWLWYPLFALLVFVVVGYCSVALTLLELPRNGVRLPWIVRNEYVKVSKLREDHRDTVTDYYLCLFGKAVHFRHSVEPTPIHYDQSDIVE